MRLAQGFTARMAGVFLVATSLTLPAAARAQAASPQPPGRRSLDVLVTDKDGNPISGLEERDFTLLDNGEPRPLVGFRAMDPHTDPNAVQVIIAVDMINTGLSSIAYQREELREFLTQNGGKLTYPMRLAVLTERGVTLTPGATTDGNAMLATFDKVSTDKRIIPAAAGFYGAMARIEYSLTALHQLMGFEAKQPGRKVTILISPGWPMLPVAGGQETTAQNNWIFNTLTQLTDQLQSEQISLYSVEPYALGRTDPFLYRIFLKPVRRPEQGEYGVLALQVLAEHSGGRVLAMGHDVRSQLNSAVRDAGPYYRITFETAEQAKPNEYHDLGVKLNQPGYVVYTSAGYYSRIEPVGLKKEKPTQAPKPF